MKYWLCAFLFAAELFALDNKETNSAVTNQECFVPFRRLVFKAQVAYLRTGNKVAEEPFTGSVVMQNQAFVKTMSYSNGLLHGTEHTRGNNWEKLVTYSNGVLNGKEVMIVGSRLFYGFVYTNGEVDVTSLEYFPPEKRKPEFYQKAGTPLNHPKP